MLRMLPMSPMSPKQIEQYFTNVTISADMLQFRMFPAVDDGDGVGSNARGVSCGWVADGVGITRHWN
jgi:hypothetical protein